MKQVKTTVQAKLDAITAHLGRIERGECEVPVGLTLPEMEADKAHLTNTLNQLKGSV